MRKVLCIIIQSISNLTIKFLIIIIFRTLCHFIDKDAGEA